MRAGAPQAARDMTHAIELGNEDATRRLGERLGALLVQQDVILLSGPLGAGKTTLARGVISALTGIGEAPSPSFPLVLTYDAPALTLWHFDLFRIERVDEIVELGWDEALAAGASLVEWPERLGALAPPDALLVSLTATGEGRRATFDGPPAWRARLAAAGIMPRP